MAPTFESHSFLPSYDVEVDPEFPPDGIWADPVHCFDTHGSRSDTVATRWGPPFIARISPGSSGHPWVGMFESGALAEGASEAHACPNPTQLCVVVGGLAYLVDAERAGADATRLLTPVTQIVAVDAPALLVLVTFSEAVALSDQGIAWRTERIALDGLRVDRVNGSEIHCAADNLEGGWDALVLDASSGRQSSGRRFGSIWPPNALA
jgi:hypothetical protein